MWMNLVMTAGYGFNFFFPTLISGLNIGNNITALLLTSPPYLLGAVLAMSIAWNSDRLRERGYHMLGALLAAIVGYIITLSTTNIAARYAATFFYCPGAFAANALVYSWAMSTLSATPEKRPPAAPPSTSSAILGMLYPHTSFSRGSGRRTAWRLLSCWCLLR